MKILLTGSTGFLGKYIFSELVNANEIYTMGRTNCNFLYDLNSPSIKFNKKFDLVIHAAGKAHHIPKSNEEKIDLFNINVQGTNNLLNSLLEFKPKLFVFISSVAVYGYSSGKSINENYDLKATDAYGLSKILAERYIKEWCNKHNVKCTILRLPLVVGTNPKGNLKSMIQAIKYGYYFNISGGFTKKSMVLAQDVSKYILNAAETGGIFNLTDGYHPSFNELSRSISLQMGRKIVPNIPLFFAKILAMFGDLIGDGFPINSTKLTKIIEPLTFDDTQARKAFGWNPSSVLKEFKVQNNV
jgi:nucleoside-diphosphate-sugar epimerase